MNTAPSHQPKTVADVERDLRVSNVKLALQLVPRSNYEVRARLWKELADDAEARCGAGREAVMS
jgi:hypothetical protein